VYLLTLQDRKDDGAYAVADQYGEKVLFLFQDEDDAERYAMMLSDNDHYEKPMEVIEVDDDVAVKTCRIHNYKYAVITPNDFVIPPKNQSLD